MKNDDVEFFIRAIDRRPTELPPQFRGRMLTDADLPALEAYFLAELTEETERDRPANVPEEE